jgi:CRP/FNR family transcriptional regulator, cyclic AMP receptor protein
MRQCSALPEEVRTTKRLLQTVNSFTHLFDLACETDFMSMERTMERNSIHMHPLLSAFTEAEMCYLHKRAVRKNWGKGQIIFRKGDPCSGMYYVFSGLIIAQLESDCGQSRPLSTYGPGNILGKLAMLDGGPHVVTAMAREASSALLLDRRDFMAIVASRTELYAHLYRHLCNDIRAFHETIEATVFLDVPGRLARLVLYLHQRHAMTDEKLKPPSLHFSQREIAELLGLSREWVARELAKWRKAGIVELRRNRLVIREKCALERMASTSVPPGESLQRVQYGRVI